MVISCNTLFVAVRSSLPISPEHCPQQWKFAIWRIIDSPSQRQLERAVRIAEEFSTCVLKEVFNASVS